MHLSCKCASKFAPEGQWRLQLAPFLQTSRRDWVLVRVSRFRFQCFSQASGASRSQHCLTSFLLTKDGSRGCNAVGCTNTNEHRPTNNRNSSSARNPNCNYSPNSVFCLLLSTSWLCACSSCSDIAIIPHLTACCCWSSAPWPAPLACAPSVVL